MEALIPETHIAVADDQLIYDKIEPGSFRLLTLEGSTCVSDPSESSRYDSVGTRTRQSLRSTLGTEKRERAKVNMNILSEDDEHQGLHFRLKTFRLPQPRYTRLEADVQWTLDRSPSYCAVSYTWSQKRSRRVKKIFINDHRFLVDVDLWYCLEALSKIRPFLWIDAICINQKNIEERNAQVRRMGAVYEGADNVSVWLGMPEPAWPPRASTDMNAGNETQQRRNMELSERSWWQMYIGNLANRSYWSRIWVIQEYWLARRITLHCGEHRLHENSFNRVFSWATGIDLAEFSIGLVYFDINTCTKDREEKLVRESKFQALDLLMGRRVFAGPGSDWMPTLYDLLKLNPHSNCHDARDRIFGILGPLQDIERQQLLMIHGFPDYTLSEDQVYASILFHLSFVAGRRPVRPVLQALRLPEREAQQILKYMKAIPHRELLNRLRKGRFAAFLPKRLSKRKRRRNRMFHERWLNHISMDLTLNDWSGLRSGVLNNISYMMAQYEK